uniref:Ubiquitin carboxyl-terminal hydrolase 36 n=1 Tax=Petromyzon marinus TaxID=7757 RepID=S4R4F9_PETMA
SLRWENDVGKGAGLRNLGNTCFLNATLQCLAYTPPLVNYLLLQEHCSTCKYPDLLTLPILCTLIFFRHVGELLKDVIRSCTCIAKHLRIGRQEDAHEFLRYVVDAMQASCLHGHSDTVRNKQLSSPARKVKDGFETSLYGEKLAYTINETFRPHVGEHLKDVIRSCTCHFVPMSISLQASPNTCALGGRKMPTSFCVTMRNKLNVYTPLSVQRWTKCLSMLENITYPEHLDMQPFTSTSQGEPAIYSLYSVLVHKGADSNSGHYYCYNK